MGGDVHGGIRAWASGVVKRFDASGRGEVKKNAKYGGTTLAYVRKAVILMAVITTTSKIAQANLVITPASTPAPVPKKRRGFLSRDGFSFYNSNDGLFRVCVALRGVSEIKRSEPVKIDDAVRGAVATRNAAKGNKKYGKVFIEPNLPPAFREVVSSSSLDGHFVDDLACGHSMKRTHPTVTARRYCYKCSSVPVGERVKTASLASD